MQHGITKKQQVIDYLVEKNIQEFAIKDIRDDLSQIPINTLNTIVTRDLKNSRMIVKTTKTKGKSRIYRFVYFSAPKQQKFSLTPKTEETKEKQEIMTSYSTIGKSIEALLEDKNKLIAKLREDLQEMKKQLLTAEATVQDRELHIRRQGQRIHELSELVREKNGGKIKLSELQAAVNP